MYRGHEINRIAAALVLLLAVAQMPVRPLRAQESIGFGNTATEQEHVAAKKLLQRYCFECHDAETQEANVQLDTLDDTGEPARVAKILDRVLDVISNGKMPPDDAKLPSAREKALLESWLDNRLTRHAEAERQSGRWTRNRRLTVEEYNFTMQALFGVDASFADMLPADPISERGYRNNSELLGLSSLQIESYLDSARRAVKRYVQFGMIDRQPQRYHVQFEDLFYSTADRYETRKRAPSPVDFDTFAARRAAAITTAPKYVAPLGPRLAGAFTDKEAWRAAIPKLNQQYVAIPQRIPIGEMIVRVRAAGTVDRNGRFPRMRVAAGITLGDGCSMDKRILGEADVTTPLEDPSTYEFRIRLEDVLTKGSRRDEESFDRLSLFDMDQIFISNVSCDRKAIFALGLGAYSDPATGLKQIADDLKQLSNDGVNLLHLDCVEIEMLPGVGADNRPYHWHVPIDKARPGRKNETAVTQEILQQFMRQAFRRPITASEIDTKLDLFNTLRAREYTFEESLRETLAAVLISPSFLFLASNPTHGATGQTVAPTPHELAARLSYLLWLSSPDKELMQCADDGSIVRKSVLRSQAERLLADPRSRRFLESFCRQWLRLDKLANVAVDRQRYSTYDEDLAADSVRETLAYFVEVFRTDSSALDLIDSDYAILNDRLAEHYNINNVTTGRLHRVQLPQPAVRGGLLTQASLLTMNSNGVDSHPIRRGVWLLDRLLNSPPPPPPPNVPDIDESDPNFRGSSLKQRIERHREPGACQNCHKKIDPWGIPFENLDATGRWRDRIEHREAGELRSRPIDTATMLPDGQRVVGIAELKTYIRQQRAEEFGNALVDHLLTYALGRSPDYADREQVAEVQLRFRTSQYRLKGLVLAIIESRVFRQ